MGEEILFGNLIAKAKEGKIYAECVNIGDKEKDVPVPVIKLSEFEEIQHFNHVEGDDGYNLGEAGVKLVIK